MRFRNIAVAVVLAAGATLPLAGIANAQPDRDCPDFASQADAQAALDSQVGDPERLDADDDGIACETQFGEPSSAAPAPRENTQTDRSTSTGQVRTVPQGGVDTGDGSTAADPVTAPALVALAGVGAVTATAVATRRRGRQPS